MQAVVPADAVADVVPMIEPQLSAKGVGLAVDDSLASAAPVWADRDRLRQVLLNLLSNAAKFTPPNGRAVVDAVAPRDGARHGRGAGAREPRGEGSSFTIVLRRADDA